MSEKKNEAPGQVPKPSSQVNSCPDLSSFHSDENDPESFHADQPAEIPLEEAIQKTREKETKSTYLPKISLERQVKSDQPPETGTLHTEENAPLTTDQPVTLHEVLKEGRQIQHHDDERKPLKKETVIQIPAFELERAKGPRQSSFSLRNQQQPYKHQHRRYPAVLLCIFLSMYYLAVLGLLLALLVIHLTDNRYNLDATAGALQYLAVNVKSDPIIEITLTETTEECPSNFEPVVLGTWPDNRQGCYKLDDDVLVPALCDGMQDLDEQIDYYSLYKEDLYYWKGYQWCIKRAQRNSDYVLASGGCPTNYKQCSPGICMENSLSCPVTSLSIGSVSLNSEAIAYGSSNYLNIEREQGEQPLIDLAASVGGLPCFSLTSQPAVSEPYVAINDQPKGCLVYGIDQASFEIEIDNQLNFLEGNNITNKILKLPGYKEGISEINVVLAGRKRVQVKPTNLCLNMNTNKFENSGTDSSKLRLAVSALTSISLICHFLIGMTLLNLLCGRLWVKNSLRELIWEKKNLYKMILVWFIVLEVFALSLLTVFVNAYRSRISNSESYFGDLLDMNCFGSDTQASELLGSYNEFVDNNVSNLVLYVWLCFGISFLFFCTIIFTMCYMAKLYQKSKAHSLEILPRLSVPVRSSSSSKSK